MDVILAPLFEAANDFTHGKLENVVNHLEETREYYKKKQEEWNQQEADKQIKQ